MHIDPAAVLGAYLLHAIGNSKSAQNHIETLLGAALLVGAAAMALRFVIFASGLKYVGLQTTALAWVLCATLLALAVLWLVFARPWQARFDAVDRS